MLVNADQPIEREMTAHQQGLVNSCFEEGQYEAGIGILDQLRSPCHKPSQEHVRALLYISLYPPPSIELEAGALTASPTKFESPRKVRQRKLSMEPSATATDAALRILRAFALTNSPDALMRALPHFDADFNNALPTEDSYLTQAAQRITEVRCCWDLLKGGFIKRKDASKTHEGRSRIRSKDVEDDTLDTFDGNTGAVGAHAWPILEWYIDLFEKDEHLRARCGPEGYSLLLLAQIPRQTTGKPVKSDAGLVWDVVCFCFEQDLVARRRLGFRLTRLLVHLLQSAEVDAFAFTNNLLAHLHSRELHVIDRILSAIPPTPLGSAFKIILAKQYLSGTTAHHSIKTKPKPRAQPRRRGMGSDALTTSASADGGSLIPGLNEVVGKIKAIDVLRLLSHPGPQTSLELSVKMKYELATAFDHLQQGDTADSEWTTAVKDGTVYEAFDDALSDLDDAGPIGAALADNAANDLRTLQDLLRIAVAR